jgi:L-aminopeptidase/D-esterase-like protein
MRRAVLRAISAVTGLILAVGAVAPVQPRAQEVTRRTLVRARDLGVPFDGTPGPLNAITDVGGVEVGHTTLISGDGDRVVGQGPVRTGVTAVWPRGNDTPDPVFAAWFSLNGDGEMTGTTWVEDSGILEGPVMITNTLSVGIVHHAVVRWGVSRSRDFTGGGYPPWLASLPVVAETWDGTLNDIMGQHVTEEHALAAMDGAHDGPVEEGSVGGGTGMICHGFKGGIGTASRRVEILGETYTLGALVQCNYGSRQSLRIAGVPVGREIVDLMPVPDAPDEDAGSIIVVVATDAPIMPHQLKRVARRISLGLARNGSTSGNGSGDIFVAFSTANRSATSASDLSTVTLLPNGRLNALFTATVEATEEAIINAMVAAETMTGGNGVTIHALPHDRLREALRKYNRLSDAGR